MDEWGEKIAMVRREKKGGENKNMRGDDTPSQASEAKNVTFEGTAISTRAGCKKLQK